MDIYWISPTGSPVLGEYWYNVPTHVLDYFRNDSAASVYKITFTKTQKSTNAIQYKGQIEFCTPDGYYMKGVCKPAYDYKLQQETLLINGKGDKL
jgi:hypothetical protein